MRKEIFKVELDNKHPNYINNQEPYIQLSNGNYVVFCKNSAGQLNFIAYQKGGQVAIDKQELKIFQPKDNKTKQKLKIVYSPGFGSGIDPIVNRFDFKLVKLVEEKNQKGTNIEDITKYLKWKYPKAYVPNKLTKYEIASITKNEFYYIEDYDGSEKVITQNDMQKANVITKNIIQKEKEVMSNE